MFLEVVKYFFRSNTNLSVIVILPDAFIYFLVPNILACYIFMNLHILHEQANNIMLNIIIQIQNPALV